MANTSGEHQFDRLLKHAATLLVAVLLACAGFLVAHSWRAARTDQAAQLATIARLNADALDLYFTQLEIGMQNLGDDLVESNRKLDLGRAYRLVNRFQKLHTELGNVILIRADGQVLMTGNTPNNPDMPTLAGDPIFTGFRSELQQGSPFVIGQPVKGHIDSRWVVAARYAVADHAGKLAYIISANLPADMLQPSWADLTAAGVTALGLVRDDGYLVSRYPEPDAASLDDVYGQPAGGEMISYLRANRYPQSGLVDMPASGGSPASVRALRRLQHFPVTLYAEVPKSAARAALCDRMRTIYFLVVLLLAGILAYYAMSHRHRRIWSVEQRREELRRHYENTLNERSPNEIYLFDAVTLQFSYANDYALKHTGYSLEQLRQMNMLSLHPEMGIESFGAAIEPLRRGEQESVKYQTVQARSDGSTYAVEVTVQLMKSDVDGEGFMAIINDITAFKQAEENIRKFNFPVERRAARRK